MALIIEPATKKSVHWRQPPLSEQTIAIRHARALFESASHLLYSCEHDLKHSRTTVPADRIRSLTLQANDLLDQVMQKPKEKFEPKQPPAMETQEPTVEVFNKPLDTHTNVFDAVGEAEPLELEHAIPASEGLHRQSLMELKVSLSICVNDC